MRIEVGIAKAALKPEVVEATCDDVVRYRVGADVVRRAKSPGVFRTMEETICLCGLSRAEDDHFALVRDVCIDGELVERRSVEREGELELADEGG